VEHYKYHDRYKKKEKFLLPRAKLKQEEFFNGVAIKKGEVRWTGEK